MNIGITDDPVDGSDAVVIHMTSATLHGPSCDKTVYAIDSTTRTPGSDIDSLKFQGGQWTVLFGATVSAEHYGWVRMVIGLPTSYIQFYGSQYSLSSISRDNTGYRINTSFDV